MRPIHGHLQSAFPARVVLGTCPGADQCDHPWENAHDAPPCPNRAKSTPRDFREGERGAGFFAVKFSQSLVGSNLAVYCARAAGESRRGGRSGEAEASGRRRAVGRRPFHLMVRLTFL